MTEKLPTSPEEWITYVAQRFGCENDCTDVPAVLEAYRRQGMPSREELLRFLECVNDLSQFEVETRLMRGYGVFREQELPIPEVVGVMTWLRGLTR